MKIRPVSEELYPKATALLRQAYPRSRYEVRLLDKLRQEGRELHEWVCIHTNKVVAYIAFSRAYDGVQVCGYHLAPLAVNPEFQGQGIDLELLRFSLRQEVLCASTIYVRGEMSLYGQFGFEPCTLPVSALGKAGKNNQLLSLRDRATSSFVVGYEKAFGNGP